MRANITREGNAYRVTDGRTVRYAETWRPSPANRRRASECKVYNAEGEHIRTISGSPKTRKSVKRQRQHYVAPKQSYADRLAQLGAIAVD